ncbi:hypothetical protein [Solihabitans fulvus]|uniref:hypothetical protein n=1 Tax=Solihabitans fulvus TaxID=1892852 RepID=UPI001661C0A8|nr:hypothetical protein [Solihabitans fulvus]
MTGRESRAEPGSAESDASDAWLRRAAFGDLPAAEVWSAAATGSARQRWLAAVVLGGQGRYAAAAALLDPLTRHADPVLAALAGSALASHHRQLGGHAAARRRDAAALGRLAVLPGSDQATDPDSVDPDSTDWDSVNPDSVDLDGVDGRGALVDALLGLAADALGLGRLAEARRLLARARGPAVGWRAEVRIGWVTAEIELAAGRADRAVAPAEAAAGVARAAGAVRHSLKSDLVLGTALAVAGTPAGRDRAARLLKCVLSHTQVLPPLVWPSGLVLNAYDPTGVSDALDRATGALTCVLRRADAHGRRLASASPWMPTTLLRSGDPPNADPRTKFLTD